MISSLITQGSLIFRIAFWRLVASAAEFAIHHRITIQKFMPLGMIIGCGSAAYLIGRLVGEIIRAALI
ncbi:MAG: hypothetical protein GTO18_02830 [Anaerolineales bacterium]|nr:hypothetical protein [Anaerolineales bacterium]